MIKDIALQEAWTIDYAPAEMTDLNSLKSAFSDVDIVIHLASIISIQGDVGGKVSKTNIEGAKNVVEACTFNKVKKIIHISSIHAIDHDEKTELVDEDCPLAFEHKFTYNHSKALGQNVMMEECKKVGLKMVCINPTGIIGPYDFRPSRSGQMLINIYSRTLPTLVQGGFNWVDSRDVAQAILSAITKGKSGEFYLIPGHWKSFRELAIILEKTYSIKTKKMAVPIYLAMLGLPFLKLWSLLTRNAPLYTYESLMTIKESNKNISYQKAKTDLDYSPRPIEETIKDTIDFFKEAKQI